MQVRLLGPVQLRDDGGPMPIGRRVRVVRAVLALNPGRPVGVDRLVAAVWREVPPVTATAPLRERFLSAPAQRVFFHRPRPPVVTPPGPRVKPAGAVPLADGLPRSAAAAPAEALRTFRPISRPLPAPMSGVARDRG